MAPHVHPPKKEEIAEVQAAAPKMEKVIWYRSPNMRKLYFFAAILCINSATTGYDGELACLPLPQITADRLGRIHVERHAVLPKLGGLLQQSVFRYSGSPVRHVLHWFHRFAYFRANFV